MTSTATVRGKKACSSKMETLRKLGDNELMRILVDGETRALDVLMERYEKILRGFVYNIIGDSTQTEDLVQETFLRVFRRAKTFNQAKAFITWVHTIARHATWDELERQRARPSTPFSQLVEGEELDLNSYIADRDSNILEVVHQKAHARKIVWRAMFKLPQEQRQLLTLVYMEGYSYERVAEITQCGLGTIKTRIYRARQALAEQIQLPI